VEVEHAEQHAEPAKLEDDVLALAEFGDAGLPRRERSSFLSAYGPMPSGPPTWFRMIVVCGNARARSASSIS
jgi:hypothetical protein